MQPTLRMVAAAAGVSLATASRVVNGSERRVPEATRLHVLAAAAELGYTADLTAQAMARGTSATLALLVSDLTDPYFAAIAAGVAREADRAGLLVAMAVTERDAHRELKLVRALRGLRPRGMILAGSRRAGEQHGELVAELEAAVAAGTRIVTVGTEELPFPAVPVDDAGGSRALADALVALGYRRYAQLTGPTDLVTAVRRAEGFRAGLRTQGLEVLKSRRIEGDFTREGGRLGVKRFLDANPRALNDVDVLVATNDVMAVGALASLRERGLRVPDDIAVAGFDDIPLARDTAPPLTTVAVHPEATGEAAVRLFGSTPADLRQMTLSAHAASVVLRESTMR